MSAHTPDGVDDVLIRVAADVAAPAAVEPKVKAATAAAATASGLLLPAILWLLEAYVFHAPTPAPIVALLGVAVPGACTFLAGYFARHVDRTPATEG